MMTFKNMISHKARAPTNGDSWFKNIIEARAFISYRYYTLSCRHLFIITKFTFKARRRRHEHIYHGAIALLINMKTPHATRPRSHNIEANIFMPDDRCRPTGHIIATSPSRVGQGVTFTRPGNWPRSRAHSILAPS